MTATHSNHKGFHRHSHGNGLLTIDRCAQSSGLRAVNPALKLAYTVFLLVFCIAVESPALSVLTAALMFFVSCWFGKTPLRQMLLLMRLPLLFIVISCLAVAINLSDVPLGFCDIAVFGRFLSVTSQSIRQAGALALKAYGAASCLYFLCLSTPMSELIEALKRARIPALLIELMYLIYRYIFVLLEVQRAMTTAAESRLGFRGGKSSWRTFAMIGGNLMACAFRRSGACFDAMESRCYDGRLSFLTDYALVKAKHVLAFGLSLVLMIAAAFLLKMKGWDLF